MGIAWRVACLVCRARRRRLARRDLGICLLHRVWLVEFSGLACLVYIATYVVYMQRSKTRIATRTREQNSENQAVRTTIVLEALCAPSSDIACRQRQLRGSASNHELHYLLEYAIGRV